MYDVYHVDVGGCISDKQEFRNQMQGAHKAPFPGSAREFGCSRTYHGCQTVWNSTTLTEWLSKKGVYMAWLRRVLKYSYVPWTSAEMVDSCLAEPSSCCCNRSGIYPVRIEIRHSSVSPPFPRLRRTVITLNISTTRTAYTVLMFNEMKYSGQLCILCIWCLVSLV